ncbi:putative sulfate/molybdate transporter [Halocatena salina]|uniref:Putative sulfate/molybdate transporter n=1 Tax=Halocatena salina TaxID=2934340 RepID=A0A8U0A6Y7_9EURY|nr:putative sulfate/molybdate transporter [Halocatena salina]UPM44872.1 putative sulfate/molybdate transporter [Halocatena salina]
MTFLRENWRIPTVRFSGGGFTGAIGDSVTVIPIVVASATLTELSLPHLLLGFVAFQIVWRPYYGLPMPVEPIKALAALVSVAPSPLMSWPSRGCSPVERCSWLDGRAHSSASSGTSVSQSFAASRSR